MKSAGNLVAAAAKFPAGMQDRKDGFYRWTACLGLDINGDPPTVIDDRNAIIWFNDHLNT